MGHSKRRRPLDRVPDTMTVRAELGRTLRETRLLRRLLRVSQAVDHERRGERQAVSRD